MMKTALLSRVGGIFTSMDEQFQEVFMAGSRAWYVYTDDDEEEYGVELDEDTGTLVGLGFTAYTGESALDQLPRGTFMRYINAVQTSGTGAGFRSRSFPCGADDAPLYDGTQTTFTINGLNYAVSSTRGEKSRKPTASPTGLQGTSSTVGQGGQGGTQG